MNIAFATAEQIHPLRRLWKAAFGDTDAFLDHFFSTAFAFDRCRCVAENGEVLAALYWFGCELEGQKLAYIYAVATDPAHRGKGLCKALMEDTMTVLENQGFQGALLLPQEQWLIRMYAGMGFSPCTTITETLIPAAPAPIPVRRISATEYASLRRQLLPPGGVIQEGENLAFLETQVRFYAGQGFIAAAHADNGTLWCPEFLGDPALTPGLTKALDCREGNFRMPGHGRPFAMFRPLVEDAPKPQYFGFPFD